MYDSVGAAASPIVSYVIDVDRFTRFNTHIPASIRRDWL
jgi:hypothetical protein